MQSECTRVRWVSVCAVVMAAMALLSVRTALAVWYPGEVAMVRIDVEVGGQSGHLQWLFHDHAAIDGKWNWELPPGDEYRTIRCGQDTLATIDNLIIELDTDPAVALNFAVTAGNVDTTFTITSATVGFPAIPNPLAFATAAITATDNTGDGATVLGLFDGSKAYQARYNAPAIAWANLVDPVTTPLDASQTGSERKPAVGRMVIVDTVYSIEAQYKFKLSANDSASGTSRFDVIVPEPMTLGLMFVGGLGLLRRRNS